MFDDVFMSCLSCFICFRHSQNSYFESEFFLFYHTDTQYIFCNIFILIFICIYIHNIHNFTHVYIYSLKLCLHCLTLVYVKFLFTLYDKNLIHEISTYTCMLYLIVILVIFKLNFKLLNFLPKQFYQFLWVNTIYNVLPFKQRKWVGLLDVKSYFKRDFL